jgi:hypothetical protein
MFSLMLLASLFGLFGPLTQKMVARFNATISLLGIFFAGYFTWVEVAAWFAGRATGYQLGLPTCAYGLVFYVTIFVLSVRRGKDVNAMA